MNDWLVSPVLFSAFLILMIVGSAILRAPTPVTAALRPRRNLP